MACCCRSSALGTTLGPIRKNPVVRAAREVKFVWCSIRCDALAHEVGDGRMWAYYGETRSCCRRLKTLIIATITNQDTRT